VRARLPRSARSSRAWQTADCAGRQAQQDAHAHTGGRVAPAAVRHQARRWPAAGSPWQAGGGAGLHAFATCGRVPARLWNSLRASSQCTQRGRQAGSQPAHTAVQGEKLDGTHVVCAAWRSQEQAGCIPCGCLEHAVCAADSWQHAQGQAGGCFRAASFHHVSYKKHDWKGTSRPGKQACLCPHTAGPQAACLGHTPAPTPAQPKITGCQLSEGRQLWRTPPQTRAADGAARSAPEEEPRPLQYTPCSYSC